MAPWAGPWSHGSSASKIPTSFQSTLKRPVVKKSHIFSPSVSKPCGGSPLYGNLLVPILSGAKHLGPRCPRGKWQEFLNIRSGREATGPGDLS